MLSVLALLFSIVTSPVSAPTCETYAPRLDGVSVTVCDGRVTKMTDASGYALAYPSAK